MMTEPPLHPTAEVRILQVRDRCGSMPESADPLKLNKHHVCMSNLQTEGIFSQISCALFTPHNHSMARTEDGLKVVAPHPVEDNEQTKPVDDERTPLLGRRGGAEVDGALEAQAEQEQREHDAGATPIAEEPSTGKLVTTMSCLWLVTFFAAMGKRHRT